MCLPSLLSSKVVLFASVIFHAFAKTRQLSSHQGDKSRGGRRQSKEGGGKMKDEKDEL